MAAPHSLSWSHIHDLGLPTDHHSPPTMTGSLDASVHRTHPDSPRPVWVMGPSPGKSRREHVRASPPTPSLFSSSVIPERVTPVGVPSLSGHPVLLPTKPSSSLRGILRSAPFPGKKTNALGAGSQDPHCSAL